jgi:hypothetical protein
MNDCQVSITVFQKRMFMKFWKWGTIAFFSMVFLEVLLFKGVVMSILKSGLPCLDLIFGFLCVYIGFGWLLSIFRLSLNLRIFFFLKKKAKVASFSLKWLTTNDPFLPKKTASLIHNHQSPQVTTNTIPH